MAYYGPDGDGANMPYNFQLTLLPWDCDEIMQAIDRYEGHLPPGAWPNWVLGNHDRPRIASRVQPHQVRGAQMLLLTLRGTPTMYYGDELGMRDVPIPPDRVQDPFEKREPGMGNGRDPQRTPMAWDAQGGGFTRNGATPWLPMGSNAECSVAKQQGEKDSLLNMVRELIQLRQSHDALKVGIFQAVPSHTPIAAFTRQYADEILYILLNFEATPQDYPLPQGNLVCIFSTSPERERGIINDHVILAGGEGVILKVH
jgi:alpha-glucosidase